MRPPNGRLRPCCARPPSWVEGLDALLTIRQRLTCRQVLDKTQLDELTQTDHALTIFTCTTGGQSRFVVRCDRMAEG